MNPVQGTTTVQLNAPQPTTASTNAPAGSLMPSPATDNIDDAMTTVLVLLTKQQANDMKNGEAGVQLNKGARDCAAAQKKADEAKADANSSMHGTGFFGSIGKLVKDVGGDVLHARIDRIAGDAVSDVKAAVDSPRFWHDLESGAKMVATVAAAAAGLATTIVTAGTAAPLVVGAALALSAGGFAVSETQCLGKWSGYVGLGMEVGGAIVSWAGAPTAASSGALRFTAKLGTDAEMVAGGATVVEGTAHVKNTKFEKNVANAQADATAATNQIAKEERLTSWLVDNLSAAEQAERDTTNTLQGIVQQHNAGNLALAATRG